MNRISRRMILGLIGAGVAAAGLFAHQSTTRADDRTGGPAAFAKIEGAGDDKAKISGMIMFTSKADGVRIVASVDGLTPGKHGFHIHEKPDVSAPDLSSAGPHFNPGGHKHGGPDSAEHHAGDLGNLIADEHGHAHYDETVKGLTIEGTEGVLGHSIIIHEKEDDLTSQPAGESGKRIAGGVIDKEKNKDAEKNSEKK